MSIKPIPNVELETWIRLYYKLPCIIKEDFNNLPMPALHSTCKIYFPWRLTARQLESNTLSLYLADFRDRCTNTGQWRFDKILNEILLDYHTNERR